MIPLLTLGGLYLWTMQGESAEVCAKRAEGAITCYLDLLRPLVGRGDYERAASLCLRVRDPECYRAFGYLVPYPSLCYRLYTAGRGAVAICHLPNVER